MFDANGDRTVSIAEIQISKTSTVKTREAQSLNSSRSPSIEMKLDMLSPEVKSTIAVHLSDLREDPAAQIFSYDGLAN